MLEREILLSAVSAFGPPLVVITPLPFVHTLRLKLKGIDGRASPGVELAAQFEAHGETYQVQTSD